MGPSPGWNDRCVKAVLNVARPQFPEMHIADFVCDIRLVDASGQHDALAVGITGLMSLLDQMGARYHAREGERWWPTRLLPWLGFDVDARNDVARMEGREVAKGLRL